MVADSWSQLFQNQIPESWVQSLCLSPSIMTLPSPPPTQRLSFGSPPKTPPKDPASPKRHAEFYLHGMTDAVTLQVVYPNELSNAQGLRIFQVEDTLFRLSIFGLVQQIGMFRDTLSLPKGEGNAFEGDSESCPIQIPGISSEIFAFIINTLFGRYVCRLCYMG